MKLNNNTIKFLAVLSVVILLVTYSISLNDENPWIALKTSLISNSFAFAIVGGFFASSLVVLACELQKYQSIKRKTEDYIFGQLSPFVHKLPLYLAFRFIEKSLGIIDNECNTLSLGSLKEALLIVKRILSLPIWMSFLKSSIVKFKLHII